MKTGKSDLYKAAGVDIDLATNLLGNIKERISATRRPEVLAPIGGFGGLFRIDLTRWRRPVMVSSIDGVGTKLLVANLMNKHDTVGYDIVNHCINDIAVQGAEPLYFMDYIGIGKLRSPLYEEVIGGIADACKAQNVTLLGGETAEMPGMYGDDYDLVGCISGIVEEDELITGEKIAPGHIAIGLKSSGLHTNGYSLARKALFEQASYTINCKPEELGGLSVGEALLKPHLCYWAAIKKALAASVKLDGIAHITGGGLYDNVPRILPEGVMVKFDAPNIQEAPAIFNLIQKCGNISDPEMYRVFNMGIGMIWFVPEEEVGVALEVCLGTGFDAAVIGKVYPGNGEVEIVF